MRGGEKKEFVRLGLVGFRLVGGESWVWVGGESWDCKKNGVQGLHAEVFVLWIGLVDWELLEERRGYPRGRRWRAFYCGDNRFDNNKREQGSRCEPVCWAWGREKDLRHGKCGSNTSCDFVALHYVGIVCEDVKGGAEKKLAAEEKRGFLERKKDAGL